MESCLNGRPIDFAKSARSFLDEVKWNGVQLVPAGWIDESTRLDTTADPAPQYLNPWWANAEVAGRHDYYAAGEHGQKSYPVL
jgi:hypothetical protein